MKNLLLLIAASLVLTTSACKKESTAQVTLSNSWTLGTTSHTTAFTSRINVNSMFAITAMDGVPQGSNPTVNTCIVYFAAAPTASGTYRVVSYPSALTSMQVGVVAGGSTGTYTSTGTGAVDVKVTVTNGKIQAVIPELTVKKINATEELKLSGSISEL